MRRLPQKALSAAALALCTALGSAAADLPVESAYPVGETLVYRVKYSGLSAGTATMAVRTIEEIGGLRLARLEMRAVSGWLASRFARIDDSAKSLVDLSTRCAIQYRLERSEGERHELEEVSFDRASGKVRTRWLSESGIEQAGEYELVWQDGPPAQDAVSLFYWLRTVNLEEGSSFDATVYERAGVHRLRIAVEAVERIRVWGLGVFRAFRLRPQAGFGGFFAKRGTAVFWLEEKTRVLLRMVVEAKWGSAGMYLIKAENSPLLRCGAGQDPKD